MLPIDIGIQRAAPMVVNDEGRGGGDVLGGRVWRHVEASTIAGAVSRHVISATRGSSFMLLTGYFRCASINVFVLIVASTPSIVKSSHEANPQPAPRLRTKSAIVARCKPLRYPASTFAMTSCGAASIGRFNWGNL